MQAARSVRLSRSARPGRRLLLIGLLLGAAALRSGVERPPEARSPRWPAEDGLFVVGGWTAGAPEVEAAWGIEHVSRTYRRADGAIATLAISTSPVAKGLYRVAPGLPFEGRGYAVEPLPPVPIAPGFGALGLRRGAEAMVLMYAYGERRGLVGNGWGGWSLAALDATLGRPNDYYLLRLLVPLEQHDMGHQDAAAARAAELAAALFPRLTAWYAD